MKQNRLQLHTVLRTALALCLALLLILGCVGPGWAVDLSRDCTIRIPLGTGEVSDALQEADLVADLYRVADAVAIDGEDAYTFSACAPYAALDLSAALTQEDWSALAARAADFAREADTPVIAQSPADATLGAGDDKLAPGLYLLLLHGKDETELGANGEGVAYAGAYRYLFAPLLIALPGKPVQDGSQSTASPGEWLYDVTVYPKFEQEQAYGKLEIIKQLNGYNADNPAMFVFSVEALLRGELVYSDVLTLEFSAAGTQSLVVEHLPIGAEVTVSECYCSPGYMLISEPELTVTIGDTETASVQFVNKYVGSPNCLRAIDNCFSYDGTTGWVCTKTWIPD